MTRKGMESCLRITTVTAAVIIKCITLPVLRSAVGEMNCACVLNKRLSSVSEATL